MTRIALIHATPASAGPAQAAFADRFPEATLWNLLDDRLIVEADAAGGLTPALRERMTDLIGYAVRGGADAVLLTCSMYGPAVAGRWPVPVQASDQALFERIRNDRPARVAVLGPLASGVADTVARLLDFLVGVPAEVEGVVVDAARAGDAAGLRELLAEAARGIEPTADLIVLGQYSISPAVGAVAAAVSVPVLSPPHLAAEALRAALTGAGPR